SVGYAFALDQFKANVRAGGRAQHHFGTGIQRTQKTGRAHGEVVRNGQGAQEHAVLVQTGNLGAFAQGVDVIVVRAGDQLGQAGAATRDLQESHFGRLGSRLGHVHIG